jgi:hypothetical protein
MRAKFVLFVLSFVIWSAGHTVSSQQAEPGSSGPRVALLMGNASYSNADPKLTQPIGNARALADELTRDGFQVEEGENLTKEASNAPSAVFTTR